MSETNEPVGNLSRIAHFAFAHMADAHYAYLVIISVLVVICLAVIAKMALKATTLRKDLLNAQAMIERAGGASGFGRHFEAISQRTQGLPSLRDSWRQFVANRISYQQSAGVAVFSRHPSSIFSRSSIFGDWKKYAALPGILLSVSLFTAIISLVGSLTSILTVAQDVPQAGTPTALPGLAKTPDLLMQRLLEAGRTSFALIAAGLGLWLASFAAMRICFSRIDAALTDFTDALAQRIEIKSPEEVLVEKLSSRPVFPKSEGTAAEVAQLINAIDTLPTHIDEALTRLKATIVQEMSETARDQHRQQKQIADDLAALIDTAVTKPLLAAYKERDVGPSSSGTAALSLAANVEPVPISIEPFNALQAETADDLRRHTQALLAEHHTRLEHQIAQRIGREFSALSSSIGTQLSAQIESAAGRGGPDVHTLVSRIGEELHDRLSRQFSSSPIADIKDSMDGIRDLQAALQREQSALSEAVTRSHQSNSQLLADHHAESVRMADHRMADAFKHLESRLDGISEHLLTSHSTHAAKAGDLENRIRTELAALRLTLQQQHQEAAASRIRDVSQINEHFSNQMEMHVTHPMRTLTTAVTEISQLTSASTHEFGRLRSDMTTAHTETTVSISTMIEGLRSSFAGLSDCVHHAIDAASTHRSIIDQTRTVLTDISSATRQLEQNESRNAKHLIETIETAPAIWQRESAAAIRSVHTATELARVKLEEKLSAAVLEATGEIHRKTMGLIETIASTDSKRSLANDEMRTQVVEALTAMSLLAKQLDSAVATVASADINGLLADAKLQLRATTADLQSATVKLTEESRAAASRLTDGTNRIETAIAQQLSDLVPKLVHGNRSATEARLLANAEQHGMENERGQQARGSGLSEPDQLGETLSALSQELRKAHSKMSRTAPNASGGSSTSTASPRTFATTGSTPRAGFVAGDKKPKTGLAVHDGAGSDARALEPQDSASVDDVVESALTQFIDRKRASLPSPRK